MSHRICTIDGCTDPVLARGWCGMHYARWRRLGDPSAVRVRQARKGEPLEFLRSLPRGIAECIPWPYARSDNGYGVVLIDGSTTSASRACCSIHHGPAPHGMEAAHSCGRGRFGCVNPDHLSWKTVEQNTADKTAHGTVLQGSRHPGSKITEGEAVEIRSLAGTLTRREIASRYGLQTGTVHDIITRKTWRHV